MISIAGEATGPRDMRDNWHDGDSCCSLVDLFDKALAAFEVGRREIWI